MAKRGPKTEEGKAVVRLNPVRHGVLSPTPVIPGLEREEDWQAHRTGVLSSLTPKGHLEMALADRVALLLWRLARITRYESAIIDSAQRRIPEDLIEARRRGADEVTPVVKGLDLHEGLVWEALMGEDTTPVSGHFALEIMSEVAEEAHVDLDEVDLPDPWNRPDFDPEASESWTIGLVRQMLEAIAAQAGRKLGEVLVKVWARLTEEAPGRDLQVKRFAREYERQKWERLLPDEPSLGKVIRYEAHLHRQLLQTLHELEAIQARRQGLRTPLARVDVQGLADQ